MTFLGSSQTYRSVFRPTISPRQSDDAIVIIGSFMSRVPLLLLISYLMILLQRIVLIANIGRNVFDSSIRTAPKDTVLNSNAPSPNTI